ncbi:hypothetical protein INT47_007601 [Mucor saturninus]|uniref:Rhomboid-type serine protease n=1 Tax=Mucor saturninus TaxID=64648 RepID=A0A8H7VA50_9FUNG|nr:hypothetical protein INT47_007601 [Mucor saturninus]
MYPVHPTSTNHTTLSNTPSSINSPSRHGRKLSHVQFGKRPYNLQDEYTSSAFMMPFDENKQIVGGTDSTIGMLKSSCSSQEENQLIDPVVLPTKRQRLVNWFYTTANIGPFIKGDHWPLFTYLVVAFTVIIFSGEMLLSPSMEILIQSGARFPPCMRKVESMPPDQRYICLHTISQSNLTPIAAAASNRTQLSPFNDQPLILLDPVVNMTDHRLFNLTCSLSTICGMSSFYQYRIPDQTYRFFTPLFIHTGLVHLCINMAVLIMLGVKVERTINSLRFTLLFIGSGMFGHALGANFAPPTSPFLGCSSSLLGLAGFLYTDLMMNWKTLEKPISNLFKLIVITGLCFFIGLIPGVGVWSHTGFLPNTCQMVA